MNRDERANTDGRIGPCRRTKTVPAGRRIGLARRRHAALRTEDARIDDAEGRNVLRFGPGIAPASVSLVNYPEGWSLLAYGDQGDALRIEAGVLGAEESRSAGYGGKSRSAWDGEQTAANDIEGRIAA